MIAIDTNVLIRFLVRDDESQFEKASAILRNQNTLIFIPQLVIIEAIWVLRSRYKYVKAVIIEIMEKLLCTESLVIEENDFIKNVLEIWKNGSGDFSDYFILESARKMHCSKTYTFDQKLKMHEYVSIL